MAEHKFTCPACMKTLTADDEASLFAKVREHAQTDHGMQMTEERFREMLASRKA